LRGIEITALYKGIELCRSDIHCPPMATGGLAPTKHPNDHLGLVQPHEPPVPVEPWAELPKVLTLAKQRHVAMKISGACTLSREQFPYTDIWNPVCRVIAAFGIDRCMWGTDWTRAVKFLSYAQAVEAFRVTERISQSDKVRLMGGTLVGIYGWSPRQT